MSVRSRPGNWFAWTGWKRLHPNVQAAAVTAVPALLAVVVGLGATRSHDQQILSDALKAKQSANETLIRATEIRNESQRIQESAALGVQAGKTLTLLDGKLHVSCRIETLSFHKPYRNRELPVSAIVELCRRVGYLGGDPTLCQQFATKLKGCPTPDAALALVHRMSPGSKVHIKGLSHSDPDDDNEIADLKNRAFANLQIEVLEGGSWVGQENLKDNWYFPGDVVKLMVANRPIQLDIENICHEKHNKGQNEREAVYIKAHYS